MPDRVGIVWIEPPTNLERAIQQYGVRVMVAIKAVADFIATKAQNLMRTNAPWTDRTGNARSGLFSLATMAAEDAVVIYLSHGQSVYYGIYLETGYGWRYAIIVPTLLQVADELWQMINDLFS